jgi:general stress protein 26
MTKISNLKEEAWSHFEDFQYVFLATVESNQPRVRPVTLIYFDDKFWFMTGTKSAKVRQIRKNSKIEFCLYLQKEGNGCYVRVAGVARIIMDKERKSKIAEHCDFFSKYWKSVDDPDYTLIEMLPIEIEYLNPGEFLARKFKL